MILRLVKLEIMDDKTEAFIEIFKESKSYIESMKGCKGVKLKRDVSHENVFFTYSIWESEEDLNYYRNTERFAEIWQRTKALFKQKAIAWSLKDIDI